MVEFALVMPLFMGLLLGTMQQGIAGMVASDFGNAVVSAARHVRTGDADGAKNKKAFKTLICNSMLDPPATCLQRLHVDVRPIAGFAAAATEAADVDAGKDRFDSGAAGAVMLVTANYDWPMFTPFLGDGFSRAGSTQARFTAHLLFKNEPFQ
jgi:Flp pilus assembly protein TadG